LYDAELQKEVVDPSIVFQLAWALMRSKNKREIKEGCVLFQSIPHPRIVVLSCTFAV